MVAPTNAQKQTLQLDQNFRDEVKWAVLTLALYWKNNDGTNMPTKEDSEKWFKHRSYSASILNDVNVVSNQIDQWSAIFAVHLKDYDIVNDASAIDAAVVVAYMKSNGMFESIANKVFDHKVQGIVL